jgi:predicted transcriptional regulator
MSEVFEIIRSAKSIPLDELVLRSSQPPEAVTHEVRMLARDGLIQVNGNIPAGAELVASASDTIVMLTSKGIAAST